MSTVPDEGTVTAARAATVGQTGSTSRTHPGPLTGAAPLPYGACGPLTLADTVAAEHWTTHHEGFHCVGCGWRGNHPHEDYLAATRRHVAEATVAAMLAALPPAGVEAAAELLWDAIDEKGIRGRLCREDCSYLAQTLANAGRLTTPGTGREHELEAVTQALYAATADPDDIEVPDVARRLFLLGLRLVATHER